MNLITTLTVTSSIIAGFTIGCVVYETMHVSHANEYKSKKHTGLTQTLYGIVGATCLLAAERGCVYLTYPIKLN